MAKLLSSALVMHPVVQDELLRDDHIKRLADCTDLISDAAFRNVDELAYDASHTEILITSWGCPMIGPDELDQLPRLRLIAHIAGSVKGFLDDAVWRRGILVCNAVAANAVPVAEFTLAAILFANKRIFALNRIYLATAANHAPWTKEAPNVGNYRKTIGIIGASNVGRLVLSHLKRFDFKVLLYDPYTTPLAARDMGAMKVGLSELLSQADVVSLHAPLLADNRHMLGPRELRLMKDGSTLFNTARGGLVDQAALEAELTSGRINAILDTTEPEVLPPDSVLYQLPNVFLTPHVAGSLGDEVQRLADYVVEEIERYAKGAGLKYLVKREHLAHLA